MQWDQNLDKGSTWIIREESGSIVQSVIGGKVPDSVKHVAIHHLLKHKDTYKVLPGNSAIAVTATATRLIDELHKLYARRASKSYGQFSTDTTNYPTSTNLKNYLEGKTDFEALTLALMATLAKQAQAKTASTGGHVFFAHFERDGKQ